MRSGRDFCSIPYQYTWVLQDRVESVLEVSMDELRFVANFLGFPNRKKSLDHRRLNAYQRKRGDWTPQSNRLYGHPEWVWNDK